MTSALTISVATAELAPTWTTQFHFKGIGNLRRDLHSRLKGQSWPMEDTRQVSLRQLASALGGDVGNGEVLAPGPGHIAGDPPLPPNPHHSPPPPFPLPS